MNKMWNILILEDNKDLLEIISQLLKSHFQTNLSIHCALDIQTAKKIIQDYEIDIALCDHQLSENETGGDLLKFIKDHKMKTKFVLCSSYLPDQFPDLYPHSWIYYNIQKPEVNEGVEELIERLEKSHFLSESDLNNKIDEKVLDNLNNKFTTLLTAENIPLNRRVFSLFLASHQDLKVKKYISGYFSYNKNLLIEVIDQLILNNVLTEECTDLRFKCYQLVFIFHFAHKLDIVSSQDLVKLVYFNFAFDFNPEKLKALKNLPFGFLEDHISLYEIVINNNGSNPANKLVACFCNIHLLAKYMIGRSENREIDKFLEGLALDRKDVGHYHDSYRAIEVYLNNLDLED
jgi:CheY-like chemotaxis protein